MLTTTPITQRWFRGRTAIVLNKVHCANAVSQNNKYFRPPYTTAGLCEQEGRRDVYTQSLKDQFNKFKSLVNIAPASARLIGSLMFMSWIYCYKSHKGYERRPEALEWQFKLTGPAAAAGVRKLVRFKRMSRKDNAKCHLRPALSFIFFYSYILR